MPQHVDATRRRVIQQNAMQMRSPNPACAFARECGLGSYAAAHETYAAERIGCAVRNRDAELLQSLESSRHQSFAARFVDQWNGAIRHHHAQTMTPRCDSRRQSGRSATDYEDIHRVRKTAHYKFLTEKTSYHSSKTNSAQKPGPIAASNPSVPGSGRRFFMTSSSTTSTEADDKLPVLRRQSQETSS